MVQLHFSDERDLDEDDILEDKEVVINSSFKTLGKKTEGVEKLSKKLEEENQII